jgi:hypothetical protein
VPLAEKTSLTSVYVRLSNLMYTTAHSAPLIASSANAVPACVM